MEGEQYEHQSQCEDYVDYGQEGYHPVVLGERFKNIYTVIQKLGWGHFSTVWLAFKETSNQYVALKIQRSKDTHTESAIDQLEMLTQIRKHEQDAQWVEFLSNTEKMHPKQVNAKLCRPLLLLDNFPHYGIHGKHMCSVFELMGPNLLDVIQHYEYKEKRMPIWLVKKITRDVLLGLVYLHQRCQIIHTDLKPENIMIKLQEYEQKQLIEQLKSYTIKPISMKYLKNIQTSKNPKNKKKQQKKKLKKKKLQAQGQNIQDKEQQQVSQNLPQNSLVSQSSSNTENAMNKPTNIDSIQQAKSQKNQPEVVAVETKKAQVTQQKIQKTFESDEYTDIQDGVDMSILQWKSVKIKLNDKLFFKIADMGNACFTHKHYTNDIQTRQYRSPQVLIGHEYYPNTDIFSLGCTVFEMMTNNFLFKPKKIQGIKKDEDHLYQMIEAFGPIDKDYAISGKNSAGLFNKKGKLLNGSPKNTFPISRMLFEKYGYQGEISVATQEFLLPMLTFQPNQRIDARTCLNSKWLWS